MTSQELKKEICKKLKQCIKKGANPNNDKFQQRMYDILEKQYHVMYKSINTVIKYENE